MIRVSSFVEEGHVSVCMRDNGIGFAEEYREKIGKLFQQLRSRDEFAGTGIGLSICRQIEALYNGSNSAWSTQGEKAELTVDLPFTKKKDAAFE